MQAVRNFQVVETNQTVKYIPVFEIRAGEYYGLFTQTDDGTGITIAGAKCNNERDIEQIATTQFGFAIGQKNSNLTSIHTIKSEVPKVTIIIELISMDQAATCLMYHHKIVGVQLGRSDYTPQNASPILKFFFSTFAKKNTQVDAFVNMLKKL